MNQVNGFQANRRIKTKIKAEAKTNQKNSLIALKKFQ